MSRIVGLDIGGTRSRAQLCVDGEVVAQGEAGSASITAVGAARAQAALADLLGQLPLGPVPGLDAICAGSAGSSVPGARQLLQHHLAPLTRSGRVVIVSDAMLVLPAAGLDAGVALIGGTGSVAVGSYQGRQARSGGWGYLLGDEGGGYWIVRSALRALLDRRDRGTAPGKLGDRLLQATGVSHVDDLQELFYARSHPQYWARHAPLVLDSADPPAARIAADAACALAGLAVSAAGRLGAPASLPIVLAGGLFGHAALESAVRHMIRERWPASDIRTLTRQPVTGAVRLAQAAAEAGE